MARFNFNADEEEARRELQDMISKRWTSATSLVRQDVANILNEKYNLKHRSAAWLDGYYQGCIHSLLLVISSGKAIKELFTLTENFNSWLYVLGYVNALLNTKLEELMD